MKEPKWYRWGFRDRTAPLNSVHHVEVPDPTFEGAIAKAMESTKLSVNDLEYTGRYGI
jgi:hypothetical protein